MSDNSGLEFYDPFNLPPRNPEIEQKVINQLVNEEGCIYYKSDRIAVDDIDKQRVADLFNKPDLAEKNLERLIEFFNLDAVIYPFTDDKKRDEWMQDMRAKFAPDLESFNALMRENKFKVNKMTPVFYGVPMLAKLAKSSSLSDEIKSRLEGMQEEFYGREENGEFKKTNYNYNQSTPEEKIAIVHEIEDLIQYILSQVKRIPPTPSSHTVATTE